MTDKFSENEGEGGDYIHLCNKKTNRAKMGVNRKELL